MGICWGSPDFPTPSFGRSFHDGPDLTLSSTLSDAASSAVANSHSNLTTSDGAAATPELPSSPRRYEELRVFKFAELKAATERFSHPFGEARFDGKDTIYCGLLNDGNVAGEEIAVKLVEFPQRPSRKRRSIMRAKLEFCGRLSHRNLVRLLGYCLKGRKLLLVYEPLQHCFSLEDHLYKSSADALDKMKAALPPLPWHRRLQIAFEAAQGLAHLHLMDQAFFQYFQASYVFLDRLYAVKIAPFNFLTINSSDYAGRRISKDVEIGVEAATARRRKQDVYDFGVVLLEILTGLALGRNRWSPEYGSRIEWIKKRVVDRDNLVTLMDSNMGSYPHDDAFQVAQLAVLCLEQDPRDRPKMPQIEETLRQVKIGEISFAV